jgi:hypothetical protein
MNRSGPLKYSVLFFLLLILSLSGAVADKCVPARASLEYYGEIGCAHCDLFASKVLPAAEKKTGITADAVYFDILSKDGYARCVAELAKKGVKFTIFPVLVIGNNVYQGNSAVEKNLQEELVFLGAHRTYREKIPLQAAQEAASVSGIFRPAVIPVVLAGLIDGINPCAFATMLFFVSWMYLRGGSRRRLLATGISFICGVFVAYLAIGFGLLSFFRTAAVVGLARNILRYFFTILSLAFAFISVRDAAILFRDKDPSRMVLQLPRAVKKSIHRIIRENPGQARSFSPFVPVSFALTGILVAVLELACTGQIYFPTIAYMVQSGGTGAVPVFWLLLYNLAFILPLVGVFVLAFVGVEQEKVRVWFGRHLSAGKAAIAILFFALAVLVWFSGK